MEDGVYGTAVPPFNGGEGASSAAFWGWGSGGGVGECGVSRDMPPDLTAAERLELESIRRRKQELLGEIQRLREELSEAMGEVEGLESEVPPP
uniref:Uncharacterized protein n=1 Tax=Pavo cristatus TaxID=9049 RepID=A0A8C9FTN7_PAVCR